MASQTNQATTQTRGRPKRSHLLARKTAPSFRVGETLLLRGVTRRCFDVRVEFRGLDQDLALVTLARASAIRSRCVNL